MSGSYIIPQQITSNAIPIPMMQAHLVTPVYKSVADRTNDDQFLRIRSRLSGPMVQRVGISFTGTCGFAPAKRSNGSTAV